MDPMFAHSRPRQAFNLGVVMGVAIHFTIVAGLVLVYFLALLIVRKANLSAIGINEKEFRVIYEVMKDHRRRQEASLPKEGRRTLWFKGMTLRALNGISEHEFVFLLQQARETVRLRKQAEEVEKRRQSGGLSAATTAENYPGTEPSASTVTYPRDYLPYPGQQQGDSAWSRSESEQQSPRTWSSISFHTPTRNSWPPAPPAPP